MAEVTGQELASAGSEFVGAGLEEAEAANKLESIWRNPSEKELAEYLAREYNTTADDPALQEWLRIGGDVEYAQAMMPHRIVESVDVTFGSIPVFGEGYNLGKLPQKVVRIWQRVFGTRTTYEETTTQTHTGGAGSAERRYYAGGGYGPGGGAWGGPPSGDK